MSKWIVVANSDGNISVLHLPDVQTEPVQLSSVNCGCRITCMDVRLPVEVKSCNEWYVYVSYSCLKLYQVNFLNPLYICSLVLSETLHAEDIIFVYVTWYILLLIQWKISLRLF